MTRTSFALAALLAALTSRPLPVRAGGAGPHAEVAPSTLENLQAAFAADLHARERYATFAVRAEQEGYRGVARLFRAAARSEEIRAGIHASALRHLGITPAARPPAPIAVSGTRQNLLEALAHENVERSASYPRLVREARQAGDGEAVLSFTLAHAAEGSLVQLYQAALASLSRLREPGPPLHVCTTCGHVARGGAPDHCPACLSGAEAFESVS